MMASSLQNSVTDFDLNFLDNIPQKCPVQNKALRKSSVAYLKTKLLLTDSIVHKHNSTKELLDKTQKSLLTSQEECKNVCIEYQNALEKCTKLENEVQLLQHANKNIKEQFCNIENQYQGLQSHTRQLQVLVTDYEKQIAALKVENKPPKENKLAEINNERKLIRLQKENKSYISDLCVLTEVIRNKRKLNKPIKCLLEKYEKLGKEKDIHTSDYDDSDNDNDNDEFEDVPVTFFSEDSSDTHHSQERDKNITDECNNVETSAGVAEIPVVKRDTRIDSGNNCAQSVDTGRGSSLALSDGEKSFHSPDYYMSDSPSNSLPAHSLDTVKSVNDVSTSPIHFNRSVATSPILFEHKSRVNTTDRAVSPIQVMVCTKSTSRKIGIVKDVGVNTTSLTHVKRDIVKDMEIDKQTRLQDEIPLEKSCLEVNNSNNLHYDKQNDSEIEMILNKMKFHHRIITPLPLTPSKVRSTERLRTPSLSERKVEETIDQKTLKKIDELYKIVYSLSQHITKSDFHLNISQADNVIENHNKASVISKAVLSDVNTCNAPKEDATAVTESYASNETHLFNEPEAPTCTKVSDIDLVSNIDDGNDGDNSIEDQNDLISNEANYSDVNETTATMEDDIIKIIITDTELPCTSDKDHKNHDNTTQQNETDVSITEEPVTVPCENNDTTRKFIEYSKNLTVELSKDSNIDSLVENRGFSRKIYYRNGRIIHRKRKPTKLEKMRRNLIPKCKIKRQTKSVKKLRFKPKAIARQTKSSSLINNKLAYEKAVKVMADLKRRKVSEKVLNALHSNVRNKDTSVINSIIDEKDLSKTENNEKCSTPLISNHEETPVSTQTPVNSTEAESPETKRKLRQKSVNSPVIEDPIESKRVLRPRKQSNVSLNSTTSVDSNNGKNINAESNEANKANNRKRRISSRKSFDSDNNQANNEFMTPPAKITKRTEDISLTGELLSSRRLLRSSFVRQDSEDNESNLNNGNKTLLIEADTSCNVPLGREPNIVKSPISPKALHFTAIENVNSNLNHKDLNDKLKPDNIQVVEGAVSEEPIKPKDSILCVMIERFGVPYVNYYAKKVPDTTVNQIFNLFVDKIAEINEAKSPENKDKMNSFVLELRLLNLIDFLAGLKKYLQDPDRKTELYNVILSPPAPPMTKSEQVLLYIIAELRFHWNGIDLVEEILKNIQYTLFSLNRTPDFSIIESMSHFYAVLCRYYRMKSRLRLFILDAMYCIQFKSVPVIKQCLDVWMHILPLAHMGIANTPLVTCLIYLLHFYKCEDRFNRVNEIRLILRRKYFYKITEWNETRILEMFSTSIKELRDNQLERKMLRTALIILAKRHGPKWCQNNIIKKMLLPLIDNTNSSNRVKEFCVSMLGPLMKPYPIDMKVHCEVISNKLHSMLEEKQTKHMREAIMSSLIYMSKPDNRLVKHLLQCDPQKVSPEFEALVKDYVKTKSVRAWKSTLSNITL